MRLRNYKETLPYTIEDTLLDVQPHSLEEPFHWCPKPGSPVWVNVPDANGCARKWRRGIIYDEGEQVFTDKGIFRSYLVTFSVKRQEKQQYFVPGLQPELKPDSPEVRELLRIAGVFI